MHTKPILTAAWLAPRGRWSGVRHCRRPRSAHHLQPDPHDHLFSGLHPVCSPVRAYSGPATSGNSTSFTYWAYIFPAMIAGTIGVDITFNVTNVFITTAMPRRHQAAAGGLINSLLYLGIAFWLGIGELAVSATVQSRGGHDKVDAREQYRIGFWTALGLAIVSLGLVLTIKMGSAEASMTADEKAEMESRLQSRQQSQMQLEEQPPQAQAQQQQS